MLDTSMSDTNVTVTYSKVKQRKYLLRVKNIFSTSFIISI